jgi:hypothetical protein
MYLAQLNIAHAKYDVDGPELQDFNDRIDEINALAESQSGFIWRLKDESGNATSIDFFDDPRMIVNMSVWKDQESLKAFVFETAHLEVLKRKKEWFANIKQSHQVMWWIPEDMDGMPTLTEAQARLEHLREHGETPLAFTFRSRYSAEDALNNRFC